MKSIFTKFFLNKCMLGIMLIAIGVLNYHGDSAFGWLDIVSIAVTVLCMVCIYVIMPRFKYEPEDEMTRKHEMMAQAFMYNWLTIAVFACALIALMLQFVSGNEMKFELRWSYVYMIFGALQVIEFVVFVLIEKKGDLVE